MAKHTVHLIASSAAILYAQHEVDAASAEDAKAQVTKMMEEGSPDLTWHTAKNSIAMPGKSESAFIAGVESDDGEDELHTGQQAETGTNAKTAAEGAAKTVDGTEVIPARDADGGDTKGRPLMPPTNQPVGGRFNRNASTLATPVPLGAAEPGPAKSRPGAEPRPRDATVSDPTKSPTPAVDGTTHLPQAQRSQAIPTPGRTIGTLGREPRDQSEVHPASPAEAARVEQQRRREGRATETQHPAEAKTSAEAEAKPGAQHAA